MVPVWMGLSMVKEDAHASKLEEEESDMDESDYDEEDSEGADVGLQPLDTVVTNASGAKGPDVGKEAALGGDGMEFLNPRHAIKIE